MSPDERAVANLIVAAMRRTRALLLAELVAWAAVAGAVSVEAARVVAAPPAQELAAAAAAVLLTAAAVGVRRRGRFSRAAIVRALERAQPASRNVIATASELAAGTLRAPEPIRNRVFADAARVARAADLRTAAPARPAIAAAAVALIACGAAAIPVSWRATLRQIAPNALGRQSSAPAAAMRVVVTVTPPAYTRLEAVTLANPASVQALEGSTLAVTAQSASAGVTLEHDGAVGALSQQTGGTFAGRVIVTKTGYMRVADRNDLSRTIPIVVVPDALPSVRLTAPGRDLVYADGSARIVFDTHAADDLGLRSLALRYTKVSGSGENFEFADGEIPLEVTRASAREWTGRASKSLAELGLKSGEMLVYHAVAADARPGGGTGSSDTFFIEISRLGVAAGDAFTMPEEESRYALSQQMLIVKTDRLRQRRVALGADAFREEALNLAAEQRMIRAELVFLLGGEVEDEEVEAEQSVELQEGRLQNRAQRDLRAATLAMSQAEKALTAANTTDALTAERAAVTALQRAFARERYILRALATRTELDVARRLTGELASAGQWRRISPAATANRRAALLADLVAGLGVLAGDRAGVRNRAGVLAAEAIRIDPASAALREVANALQRVQDEAADRVVVDRALTAATAAAVAESRRAHGDPAVAAAIPAADLTGRFAEALRGGR